jgi:hypothetical protein
MINALAIGIQRFDLFLQIISYKLIYYISLFKYYKKKNNKINNL